MTTITHNTEYDFQTSHLVEGGIALFALGITLGSLIAAGMTSAVIVGTAAATMAYFVSQR